MTATITTDEEALLASVTAAAKDDLPRLVYADWLDEHGRHARAEFIRTQVALARTPGRSRRRDALWSRAAALLNEHRNEWLAELGIAVSRGEFARGFLTTAELTTDEFVRHGDRLVRLAPVRALSLTELGDRAALLAACPALARVSALHLSDYRAREVGRPVTPLFGSPHLTRLRSLTLAAGLTADFGALAASRSLTGLRDLDMNCYEQGRIDVEALASGPALAGLTSLFLESQWLDDDDAEALARPAAFPRLRTLGLHCNELTDDGACALARATALPSLRYLDVAYNEIGDAGLIALAGRPGLTMWPADGNLASEEVLAAILK